VIYPLNRKKSNSSIANHCWSLLAVRKLSLL